MRIQGITVLSGREIRGTPALLPNRTALLLALVALVLPGGSLVVGAYWLYARLNSRMSKPQ